MLIPIVLVILLIVAGLGFMMYKRCKNRLKKQRAKVAHLTQMIRPCNVKKTDWINSKMTENDWSQAQGEVVQKCKVPGNLQARIR